MITHNDFEQLLKMAHGSNAMPCASSLATTGISVRDPIFLWLTDSSATDHMISYCQLFSTFSIFPKPEYVSLANGRYTPTIGNPRFSTSDIRETTYWRYVGDSEICQR